jgi:hypothetical protein
VATATPWLACSCFTISSFAFAQPISLQAAGDNDLNIYLWFPEFSWFQSSFFALCDPENTGIGAKGRNFVKNLPLDFDDEGVIDPSGTSVAATVSDFLVILVSVLESSLRFAVVGGGILEAETSAAISLSANTAFGKTGKHGDYGGR